MFFLAAGLLFFIPRLYSNRKMVRLEILVYIDITVSEQLDFVLWIR
jgi:hypothetical protein